MLILAFACLIAAGWLRSLHVCDVINVPFDSESALTLSSVYGSLVYRVGWIGENPWDQFEWSDREFARDFGTALPLVPDLEYLAEVPLPTGEGDVVTWYFIGCGFGFGKSSLMDPYHRQCSYTVVPYWSTVIPLSLLSASLLLSRPRQKSPAPSDVHQ